MRRLVKLQGGLVNAPQPTDFTMALYTAEPEEHDLTVHEFAHERYERVTPSISMQVNEEADHLAFVIVFTGSFRRLTGHVEWFALLGNGKLLRAKHVPADMDGVATYDFSYVLNADIDEPSGIYVQPLGAPGPLLIPTRQFPTPRMTGGDAYGMGRTIEAEIAKLCELYATDKITFTELDQNLDRILGIDKSDG